jgi:hypothetical protein
MKMRSYIKIDVMGMGCQGGKWMKLAVRVAIVSLRVFQFRIVTKCISKRSSAVRQSDLATSRN